MSKRLPSPAYSLYSFEIRRDVTSGRLRISGTMKRSRSIWNRGKTRAFYGYSQWNTQSTGSDITFNLEAVQTVRPVGLSETDVRGTCICLSAQPPLHPKVVEDTWSKKSCIQLCPNLQLLLTTVPLLERPPLLQPITASCKVKYIRSIPISWFLLILMDFINDCRTAAGLNKLTAWKLLDWWS